MITRKMYIEALDIVEEYRSKLKAEKQLQVGDTVVFCRSRSKYVEIGKEYQVICVSDDFSSTNGSYRIKLENNKTKRLLKDFKGYSWRIVK